MFSMVASQDPTLEFIEDGFMAYISMMRERNAVDFGDLISMCNALLSLWPLRSIYQQKFHHILVDEFQDTNQPQYEFLRCRVVYSQLTECQIVV